jgi:riboflavin kinase / FMN adenylyltransferase
VKVFYGYRDLRGKLKDPILAIGIFDGIHIGHKRVIKRVVNMDRPGRDRAVLTFDPHPEAVLRPHKSPPRIMSLEHRIHIFEKMGLDAVVVIKFSDLIAMMSPEDFIKKVIGSIGARDVFVGENFHFGKAKSGDPATFRRMGKDNGIEVRIVKPVRKGGRVVSSTWVRDLVAGGNIKKAEELLRRPVSVLGTVVGGDKRGKALGVPTANIDPHHEVIPPPGVYAVKVDVAGELWDGVINIGFRPTFYSKRHKTRKEPYIEVHLIGFDGDLYGRSLEIFFIKRLRKEKKFRTQEKLKETISGDIRRAGKFLESREILRRIQEYKYL